MFVNLFRRFVRQLHFYGFKKSEVSEGEWSFSHPNMSEENPDGVFDITRKTRVHPVSFAAKEEVRSLQKEVAKLRRTLKTEVQQVQSRIEKLTALVMKRKGPDKPERTPLACPLKKSKCDSAEDLCASTQHSQESSGLFSFFSIEPIQETPSSSCSKSDVKVEKPTSSSGKEREVEKSGYEFRFDDFPMPIQDLSFNPKQNWD